MKKVLSVPEAAQEAGLTERAAWQAIYRKRFPHRRWGRKVVVLQDELEDFLKNLPGVTVDQAITKVEEVTR